MQKWIWIGAAAAIVAFIGIVYLANDSLSVRIGAWAQFIATLGSVFAAFLAFRTADANRKQANEANQAMAEATRPQLSLTVTPNTYGPPQDNSVTGLHLTIANQSKFNVDDCRVYWEMAGGSISRKEIGPIIADGDPSSRGFGDSVAYASGLMSYATVTLGLHEMFKPSTIRVIFYYSSTFSNGEWMETHYWTTRDAIEDPRSSNWKLVHTYDPPKWIPRSLMSKQWN
ncbi:hypothetical protein DFO66_101329 [Brevibacterium sanguinis]|uniref:Uncharacterized protein n=2 Tax=Brevibacterium TaxID=1696 RepID=A0A366IQ53_9MICO|nr:MULTISPECIES: hypothetical protein [Brevibacterium]RBP68102.1 hypothetical protein DFO66_101329 [Brevibacterium sanguinis]RBP74481.1 hypothetical protein DFO65_101200 [Brevibacterium celere]